MDRFHNAVEIALHEGDPGAFHCHVGAGSHRDSHVGGGERGRVIDSIARHRHHRFRGAELFDALMFVLGRNACLHLIDAQFFRDAARGPFVVAGEHDHFQSEALQFAHGFRRRFLDRIRHRDHSGGAISDRNEHHGLTFVLECRCLRFQIFQTDDAIFAQEGRLADKDSAARGSRRHAATCRRGEIADFFENEILLLRAGDNSGSFSARRGCVPGNFSATQLSQFQHLRFAGRRAILAAGRHELAAVDRWRVVQPDSQCRLAH